MNSEPSRYWECLEKVDNTLHTMTQAELVGAYRIMKKVSEYFWTQHFDKMAVMNQRATVKTLDEITENICSELYQRASIARSESRSGPRHYFPT